MGYPDDRKWSDAIIPQIKQIVGPHLLEPTPFDMDCKQAADLYIFTAKDMRIAARVRRPNGYAEMYPYEFTLRSKRDNGVKTELQKITDGWGDWFFYGHADADLKIVLWWLVDLKSLRAALIRHQNNRRSSVLMGDKSNGDGTHFKWFDLRSFPKDPPILVAGSRPLPTGQLSFAS